MWEVVDKGGTISNSLNFKETRRPELSFIDDDDDHHHHNDDDDS
jgi:hypothetical protein